MDKGLKADKICNNAFRVHRLVNSEVIRKVLFTFKQLIKEKQTAFTRRFVYHRKWCFSLQVLQLVWYIVY